MESRNINKMNMNQFVNELSEESLNYIKDSFDNMEDALGFYRESALKSGGKSMGDFMRVEEFFSGLNNISSTEFV